MNKDKQPTNLGELEHFIIEDNDGAPLSQEQFKQMLPAMSKKMGKTATTDFLDTNQAPHRDAGEAAWNDYYSRQEAAHLKQRKTK